MDFGIEKYFSIINHFGSIHNNTIKFNNPKMYYLLIKDLEKIYYGHFIMNIHMQINGNNN